ncbi:MAG: hypothetical protein JWO48_3592, partial [Bryobacterales bacterium]|nr:hypothetical protein [Bryobacterales bacterium]
MTMLRYSFVLVALVGLVFAQANNGVVTAGYSSPSITPVAPGQVVTLFAFGVGSAVSQPVLANSLPLPTKLA